MARRNKLPREEIDRRKRVATAKKLLGRKVNYRNQGPLVYLNEKIPAQGSKVDAISHYGKCNLVCPCCNADQGWWVPDLLSLSDV